jgi:hypothetical protein
MLQLICEQLPDATLLTISHMADGTTFYSRRLAV